MIGQADINIYPKRTLHGVDPNIYGQFAEHIGGCIYGGIWVGPESSIPNIEGYRLDTLEALKKLELPVLRWPGGCFADNYHWRDGIGDPASRPMRQNIWWKQGESNAFGTHEFIRFCELIGAQPYICVNVGSGTPEEARQWVEYCNAEQDTTLTRERAANGSPEPFGVKYWGIGNENWGCGGRMNPEHYANLYRQFATFMRNTDVATYFIACGSMYHKLGWDKRVLKSLKEAEDIIDAISIHNYSGMGISDSEYSDDMYYQLMTSVDCMDRHIESAAAVCKEYSTDDHEIKVILDEWGTWYAEAITDVGLRQNSTMMDAIFSALSFHMFHRRGDVLAMTNMAQTANVLQSIVQTREEAFCLTPNYWIYDMFKPHKGGTLVKTRTRGESLTLESGKNVPLISASATIKDRSLTVSIVNVDLSRPCPVSLHIGDVQLTTVRGAMTFHSADVRDYNLPDMPDAIPEPCELKVNVDDCSISATLPPCSVSVFDLEILVK